MLKTEKIEKIVQLAIASGYIKDKEAPLSVILVAPPESAKTKIIEKFKCNHVLETADLSAKGINDVVIPLLEQNKLHHLMIPDFIKVLSHKNITTDATMAFLNALMEEGIKTSMFFGQMFKMTKRQKCGIITSITIDFYYKIFRKWHDIGFLSRFIPISFNYSPETIQQINHQISRNVTFNELQKLKQITKKDIVIPDDISDNINFISGKIIEQQKKDTIRIRMRGGKLRTYNVDFHGFRLHRQIRKLLKSITLMDGKTISTWENMNELNGLIDYIRLPKNPKEI